MSQYTPTQHNNDKKNVRHFSLICYILRKNIGIQEIKGERWYEMTKEIK
jgi:hypothetical protein